jgi:hypothetical protein
MRDKDYQDSKSMEPRKKLIITLSLAAVGCMCSLGCREERNPEALKSSSPPQLVRTNLPPGFEILCDFKAGLFAPYHGGHVYNGNLHSNRQSAINHAWWLYERKPDTNEVKRAWERCED